MNLPNFFSISYKFFRKSCFIRRHTIAQKNFGWTYADCRISGEKGFASRLNNSLDWWCKAHFFCAYAKEVLLRVRRWFLFPLFLWAVSGKPCLTARSINGTSRHARQANREEWFYPSDRTRSDRHIKSYFLAGGLPGSTLPAMSLFLFGVFPFSRISLLKFSCLICLHFRLPPFSRLSVTPHQAVISVLGAKVIPGLDGNARSSLLFSAKISSPAGSIFPEKPCIP